MKNGEIIAAIDFLTMIKERQNNGEELFSGRAIFAISRNLRTLWKEYSTNYLEDLKELKAKYHTKSQSESGEEGEVKEELKPEYTKEDWEKALRELLDTDIDLQLTYLSPDDLVKLTTFRDVEGISFMVKTD